jgi:hypothetical protein
MKSLYFLILFFALTASAQEKVLEGSFKNLSGISNYNVVFDYSGMKVYDYESEEAFFKDKIDRRGTDKAEEFKNKWFGDREALYEPKFIAYFNERMKGKVTAAKNTTAPHTILVKSTWLYPGYSFGVGKEEAKISAVLTVYETANPANVLLKVEYDRSIGLEPTEKSGDTGYRIAGAYEKLARNFTLQLKRFVK